MLPYLPKVLVNIILEYDGRIKYEYTKGQYEAGTYVNIISKNDPRYTLLENMINRQQEMMSSVDHSPDGTGVYFDIAMNRHHRMMVGYDYNWSVPRAYERCLTTFRNDLTHLRTIIN